MKYMFKKAITFVLVAILMFAIVPPMQISAERPAAQSHQMRGLWVTSAYNLDWPSRQNMSAAEIRAEIDAILARSVAMGINAVFVQVRPTADSLFPSEIFPWSHAFTGVKGQVPAFYTLEGFDPLAYWIERAHAMGIEVHAWLNPFRITHRREGITNPAQLPANHPVRLNPSLAIAYGNALFLDPGNPAARQLIADGVAEILHNYPTIDGIHLDDYFYPSRNFPDDATFARYAGNFTDVHNWRRDNVNQMIQQLQTTIREINPRVRWGISPFAIWMNAENDPRGSNTRGSESYHSMYADTRRWVLEGWIDYIAPQIYWIEGNAAACFEQVFLWWESVVEGTGVDLYIGLAPYREVLRDTDARFSNWREGDIVRQLQRTSRSNVATGAIFFREQFTHGAMGNQIRNFYAGVLAGESFPEQVPTPPADAPTVRMTSLAVHQPARNRDIVDAANFNFFGASVPDLPLYVNNIPITNRTEEGFFNIFLPLVRGENRFTFTQPGQPNVVRIINNTAPRIIPLPLMPAPAVTNAFPAEDEWAQAGSTITLRATAPAGATVTATLGGRTVTLTQNNPNLAGTANRIYAANFSGEFTLDTTNATAITDVGRVTYRATFRGNTYTATSAGRVHSLGSEAPVFAEVTAPAVWGYPNAATAGGSGWKYVQGQVDRVTAVTGDWTRFASGLWLQSANVRRFTASAAEAAAFGTLSDGWYVMGELEDRIIWNSPVFNGVTAEFDGNELIVGMGIQNEIPPIFLPIGETLIEHIRIGTHRGAPAYFMTLREGARLEGFYAEHENGQLQLVLRRRRPLTAGNFPLYGFTFVLDAGHGGTDPGAVGMMGGVYAEAHIVMDVTWLLAERLEMLGADVHLVRDGHYNVELVDRSDLSRDVKPDMFISIHSNSTAETTNATNIHGLTMWYRNPNARPAAQTFFDHMRYINPRTNRANHINQANFRVCRPAWTPSILVELSFTNNIHDFAWMIDPRRQVDMAWGMVNSILLYYR